jgi:hypothetical protein
VLAAGCSGGQEPPAPRYVDLGAISEKDVASAVIDECHGPLRGSLDRVAAVVHLPGGADVRAFVALPDKLRAVCSDGSFLLVGDDVTKLGDGGTTATPEQVQRVHRLRTLLDAALLGPLYRATACRRVADARFELALSNGETWLLALRPDTLLPASLRGPGGEVHFADFLRTPKTWITRRAELEGLGACGIDFQHGRIDWNEAFFTAKEPSNGGGPRMTMPAAGGGEPRSPEPYVIDGRAQRWVAVEDPGTWEARTAAYTKLHAELERQDQQIAGFPLFWQQNGHRWLGAPFRRRSEGPAFEVPDGWNVRDLPAGKWLVVYPPSGDWEQRAADGDRRLRAALAAKGLQAAGEFVAQPFLHLQEGVPDVEKLRDPIVRSSVPVR